MKMLLITALALGSFSIFASDFYKCNAICVQRIFITNSNALNENDVSGELNLGVWSGENEELSGYLGTYDKGINKTFNRLKKNCGSGILVSIKKNERGSMLNFNPTPEEVCIIHR